MKRTETINLWKIHSVWEVYFDWCSLSRGSCRSWVQGGLLTRGTIFQYIRCTKPGGPAWRDDPGCRNAGALWAIVKAASSPRRRRRCPAKNNAVPEKRWRAGGVKCPCCGPALGGRSGEDGGQQTRGWENGRDVTRFLWLWYHQACLLFWLIMT